MQYIVTKDGRFITEQDLLKTPSNEYIEEKTVVLYQRTMLLGRHNKEIKELLRMVQDLLHVVMHNGETKTYNKLSKCQAYLEQWIMEIENPRVDNF